MGTEGRRSVVRHLRRREGPARARVAEAEAGINRATAGCVGRRRMRQWGTDGLPGVTGPWQTTAWSDDGVKASTVQRQTPNIRPGANGPPLSNHCKWDIIT